MSYRTHQLILVYLNDSSQNLAFDNARFGRCHPIQIDNHEHCFLTKRYVIRINSHCRCKLYQTWTEKDKKKYIYYTLKINTYLIVVVEVVDRRCTVCHLLSIATAVGRSRW